MSCFVVSQKHLSAIVRWANVHNLKAGWIAAERRFVYTPGKEQELVDLLYAANTKSVNARYKESHPEHGFEYDLSAPMLTPVEVLKACDCITYQSGEWSGFKGSEAERAVQDIKQAAVRRLPGYEEAPWEIAG